MAGSAGAAASAWKAFETTNAISTVDDSLLKFDHAAHMALLKAKPYKNDVHYYKKVKLSAVALLKMVMHSTSGGDFEVMGMLQGHASGDTIIITDSFALPVQATETRVNAASEAEQFQIDYPKAMQQVGRPEFGVGWYHSHPGYGCWLSGIDVSTQRQNQMLQGPWVALVVDPKQTMASGKVEIGAFRTYTDEYVEKQAAAAAAGATAASTQSSGPQRQSVPRAKLEEFGLHANEYYQLSVELFKTSLDTQLINLLWSKYWVNTLTASPLIANRDYLTGAVVDVVDKLDAVENHLMHAGRMGGAGGAKKEESEFVQIARDCGKIATETLHGLMNQVVKDVLFNPTRMALKPKAA